MAVLAMFTVKGDAADLQTRYDAAMPAIIAMSPGQPLAHVCTTFEGGLRIYDVWESTDQLDDFASNPRFREAIADAGLPTPTVEVAAVHRFNW